MSGRARDILAGREAVRGKTGGSAPVVVEDGAARLSVPASALQEDTAIGVTVEEPSSFLPSGLTAIGEVLVDLSGRSLGASAELSYQTALGTPGDSYVVAKVERVEGVPKLVLVALASLSGDRLVSQPYPGLLGITTEGRYVFFRTSGPLGFVAGTTTTSTGAVKAIVASDQAPFVAIGTPTGHFIVGTYPGSATLTATVPGTTVTGTASASVTAGETASADITLTGILTTATVTPQDGAQGLSVNLQLEIETTAPLKADTVTPANVKLYEIAGANEIDTAVRLVLSGSRRVLAVVPQQALKYATSYRLQASGLADVYGASVSVPGVTFTTKPSTPPQYDTAKLVFSFPDQDGLVHLTAPAGTLAPGSQILIINSGNGFVATFTAENDGAVGALIPATFPASINDSLLVTITDPLGNVTTFTRSQFEDPVTGETAIGPGGGVVKAKDGSGTELRIPEGALEAGASFKLEGLTADEIEQAYPGQEPNLGTDASGNAVAHIGSGLKIESPQKPHLKEEAKLAFPVPDFTRVGEGQRPPNPSDAFFYVVQRVLGPCRDGSESCADDDRAVLFQTLDHAFIEGEGANARVVTASPPFLGYVESIGMTFSGAGVFTQGTATAVALLFWTYDLFTVGRAIPGVITGIVRREVFKKNDPTNPDAAGVQYEPVEKALVVSYDQACQQLLDGTRQWEFARDFRERRQARNGERVELPVLKSLSDDAPDDHVSTREGRTTHDSPRASGRARSAGATRP